ncbi:MAG: RluA family pseudouridine synthase [Planctomycetota bacterium]
MATSESAESSPVAVLYEDNHLLVINKPAAWSTMGDTRRPSVHQWGCRYIREKYKKPGRVFLGVVHRLDHQTTGVLVLARTSKAASRLSQQFQDKASEPNDGIQKTYLAITDGIPEPVEGRWEDWVVKDDAAQRMRVVQAGRKDAKRALADVQLIAADHAGAMLKIHLVTGRKHQIRLQCAQRGAPILGDNKYGPQSARDPWFLHSSQLRIEHPTLRKPMLFTCAPPRSWRSRLHRLGISSLDKIVSK